MCIAVSTSTPCIKNIFLICFRSFGVDVIFKEHIFAIYKLQIFMHQLHPFFFPGCYKEMMVTNETETISINADGFPENETLTCVLKIFAPDDYAVVINFHQPRNATGDDEMIIVSYRFSMTLLYYFNCNIINLLTIFSTVKPIVKANYSMRPLFYKGNILNYSSICFIPNV